MLNVEICVMRWRGLEVTWKDVVVVTKEIKGSRMSTRQSTRQSGNEDDGSEPIDLRKGKEAMILT